MTQDEFLDQVVTRAKEFWGNYWSSLPNEEGLRLSSMEAEIAAIGQRFQRALWELLGEEMKTLGEQREGYCVCNRRREWRREVVKVDVLGHRIDFPSTYFYCRHCHIGVNPVRIWLGLESGGVSLGYERALTELTTRMTFGDAVESMNEHHGQAVDRTKAERVTYAVAREGEAYLQQRRNTARTRLQSGEHEGTEQLVFTADGGAIPVGTFSRPASTTGPTTPVRKLPVATRSIVGREARFISVRAAESTQGRVVDCHIAPREQTRYTGERMFAAAIEAGLRDNSKIHGVFDMGKWIQTQFVEQFMVYTSTACADSMHVADYLVDAGRVIASPEQAVGFGMARKQRILDGDFDSVLAELKSHCCEAHCLKNENNKCLARVAEGYLFNNQDYMKNYAEFIRQNLPVGSGEAESGIRHIIRRRMDVAGAWTEENASCMFALLTIRASGWWDDFWTWRSLQDKAAWKNRQEGTVKARFRGRRRVQVESRVRSAA